MSSSCEEMENISRLCLRKSSLKDGARMPLETGKWVTTSCQLTKWHALAEALEGKDHLPSQSQLTSS